MILGASDVAELVAALGAPERMRPIIVTTHTSHLVWVGTNEDIQDLTDDAYELLDGAGPAFDGWVDLAEPTPSEWVGAVAGDLRDGADIYGPRNAPLLGPNWWCGECCRAHEVGAIRPRRHRPECSRAEVSAA